jgi:hypothetical protein
MAKFRKKPVVIEAFQLHNRVGTDDRPEWLKQAADEGRVVFHDQRNAPGHWTIPTLEGEMRGDHGDWIIKGVKGELYPCKPDIFEATYEPA